jgi:hypothetical protein
VSRLRLARDLYGLAPVKDILAGDLCELVPSRGFVEKRLSERETRLGIASTGPVRARFGPGEDGRGRLLARRGPVPARRGDQCAGPLGAARSPRPWASSRRSGTRGRGAVQGRGVALLRRIGSLRTPGSRLPSSPGRLRRSHRVCTRLQRYGGGSHSGPTRGETGSTNSHVGPTARNPARAPPHLHTKKAAHAAG